MGFQTPQYEIKRLLSWMQDGTIQLPDFQREYKWNDERIRSLLVTILRGHPMGVIMLLQTGGEHLHFRSRPITGASPTNGEPEYLLLDGQQRLTTLLQALSGSGVVRTEDDRRKQLERRYFIDVHKILGTPSEQDEAVLSVPADGMVRSNFNRNIDLDVSTRDRQIEAGVMPITAIFDGSSTAWMVNFAQQGEPSVQMERMRLFGAFNDEIVTRAGTYKIPAIELDNSTKRDAVTTVFEKVNTGGLALDVFELLTATFAGDVQYNRNHEHAFRLADDWEQTKTILNRYPSLHGIQRTDFLQLVTLLTTNARHNEDVRIGKGKPAATTARKEDILRLELNEYLHWSEEVRKAIPWLAQFYTEQHIHTSRDVPYRTQAVPLLAFRVLLGERIDHHRVAERIEQWFWCGVLGERYGSTIETKFALDIEKVPAWAVAAPDAIEIPVPETIASASFVESRLLSIRTRNSAAYRGIYALLMKGGCVDWMRNLRIDHASFSELQVDIHHIFPKAWCEKNGVEPHLRESIVNKTPLGKKTNIFIGGISPAIYMTKLERYATSAEALDRILTTHAVDPQALRAADFPLFFSRRRASLVDLVERAMGKTVVRDVQENQLLEDPADFSEDPFEIDDEIEDESQASLILNEG